jgi:hypothetical protein
MFHSLVGKERGCDNVTRECRFGTIRTKTLLSIFFDMRCEVSYSGGGIYNLRGELLGLMDSMDGHIEGDSYAIGCGIPSLNLQKFYQEVKIKLGQG